MILRRAGSAGKVMLPCGHVRHQVPIRLGRQEVRCTLHSCRRWHTVEMTVPPSGRTDGVLEIRYVQEVSA